MAHKNQFILRSVLLVCLCAAFMSRSNAAPLKPDADRSLFMAVRQNDMIQAREALDAGANPNLNMEEYSLLMFAAMTDKPDMMRLLLDKGADVNVKDHDGSMAIDFLASDTKVALIQKMLDAGLNAEGKSRGLVHFSAGNIHISRSGIRPAGFGPTDIVKLLLANGVNVNTKINTEVNGKPGEGVTALMMAAGSNQIGTVKLLLKNGADPQAMDPNGTTAFIYAANSANSISLLQFFIHHGLNVNTQPKHGENALQVAADDGYYENVKFLLRHGANVNAKDDRGKTSLRYAKEELATSRVNAVATDQKFQTMHDNYIKIIALLKTAGAKN